MLGDDSFGKDWSPVGKPTGLFFKIFAKAIDMMRR